MPFLRFITALALCPLLVPAASGPLSQAETQLIDSIHANTMKGHISFLASDLLEGRDTPSRGLDLAGEYIASQFRRLGLEPGAQDGSYFQVAPFVKITQPMDGFRIRLELSDGKSWESSGVNCMAFTQGAVEAKNLEVVKISLTTESDPLPAKETIRGKAVVLLATPRTPGLAAKFKALLESEPAFVIPPVFLFAQSPRLREAGAAKVPSPPAVTTTDSDFNKLASELPDGSVAGAKLSVTISVPIETPVQLRNVIAKLPGSDATLKDQYVLLTAHYDHIGVLPGGDGDRINNGANDDASGVSTVLALAEAFATAKERPRRSIVFMTYFGEEKGLLGSRYYGSHPLFPLRNTIANLNFEHMGRTDDVEGSRAGKLSATGFDYTTIGDVIVEAGKATGVETWKHERYSDMFFAHSDNQALADMGIPALSVSVAFLFPDYHRPGDHWEKIDYANMQSVVRTSALIVERIANAQAPPHWIESNPKVEKYVKAYNALQSVN